jgi:hypothetical protein
MTVRDSARVSMRPRTFAERGTLHTEWMASIDIDEYLVPMGNYTNLRDVVRDAADQGTNILSFRSTRGKLRYDSSK